MSNWLKFSGCLQAPIEIKYTSKWTPFHKSFLKYVGVPSEKAHHRKHPECVYSKSLLRSSENKNVEMLLQCQGVLPGPQNTLWVFYRKSRKWCIYAVWRHLEGQNTHPSKHSLVSIKINLQSCSIKWTRETQGTSVGCRHKLQAHWRPCLCPRPLDPCLKQLSVSLPSPETAWRQDS